MTCSDAEHLMAGAVFATIPLSDRAALDAHVESCDTCRRSLTEQEAVAAVLRSRQPSAVPSGFAARVASRVAEESGWLGIAEWRTWTLRLAPVMAAVAIAVALTVSRTTVVTPSTAQESTADPATTLMTSSGISGEALVDMALTGNISTPAESAR